MSLFDSEWPKHPLIFQINVWPWLQTLFEIHDYPVSLQSIPEEIIDLDFSHFDAIWLMGVWERSPKGREIALNHPDLQGEYKNALTDFTDEDVVGSPYAVYYYHVDHRLGSKDGLELFRDQLAEQDVKLILDYVPNHVAIDHLWTLESSDMFIQGTEEELETLPHDYFRAGNKIIAHGKDPYFLPWTDTAQINAFSEDARLKTTKTLLSIAEICDGVRCDMSMLLTNEVFSKTWGARAGPIPEKEFWYEIIPTIKNKYPDFKFIAEVYWELEYELQQLGFDYCYDKRLYDRMLNETAKSVRAHLQAEWNYQSKLLRFIENHDEKRAITAFGVEKSKAAAILALTLPGARLIHEGQMSGLKIKLPVQLGRRQVEEDNQEILEFYLRLVNALPGRKYRGGNWSLCNIEPTGDFSNTNLIAHVWWIDETYLLTVINFSPYDAKGNVRIKDVKYGETEWGFTDLLSQNVFVYEGEHLDAHGLFVDLPAWNCHIFDIRKI
jgi:hypothetical protein